MNPDSTEGVYKPGKTYPTEGKDINLYAIWRDAREHKVTYNANTTDKSVTGMPNPNPQSVGYGKKWVVSSAEPYRDSYLLAGWVSEEWKNWIKDPNDPNETRPVHLIEPGQTREVLEEDITVYAVWNPWYVTIKYDLQGGKVADPSKIENKTVLRMTIISLPPAPTRSGYVFKGWGENNKQKVTVNTNATTYQVKGDTTLYAVWNQLVTLKYDSNIDGKEKIIAQVTQEKGTPTILIDGPTREGYKFMGWATARNATSGLSEGTEYLMNNNTILYATWSAIKYKINFNPNDGTGTMQDQTMTYNIKAKLRSNAFTRDNYEFLGWSLTKDGEVKYVNEEEVLNLTKENGATIKLYAVWKQTRQNYCFLNAGKGKYYQKYTGVGDLVGVGMYSGKDEQAPILQCTTIMQEWRLNPLCSSNIRIRWKWDADDWLDENSKWNYSGQVRHYPKENKPGWRICWMWRLYYRSL